MNQLLKGAMSRLLNSKEKTDESMVYVNYNYFVKPRVLDASVKYFTENKLLTSVEFVDGGNGNTAYYLNNSVLDQFNEIVVGNIKHGFISLSICTMDELYSAVKTCRDIFVENKSGHELGNLYVHVKLLHDKKFLREKYIGLSKAKYDIVIDKEFVDATK